MATRNRLFIPNETYFITFTILGWKNIFVNDKYCNLIYKWLDYMNKEYGNKINGYVIMPNHVHVLLKITDKSPSLSVLIMNTKRFLAYGIIKYLNEEKEISLLKFFQVNARKNSKAKHKLFEDRFDSLII